MNASLTARRVPLSSEQVPRLRGAALGAADNTAAFDPALMIRTSQEYLFIGNKVSGARGSVSKLKCFGYRNCLLSGLPCQGGVIFASAYLPVRVWCCAFVMFCCDQETVLATAH